MQRVNKIIINSTKKKIINKINTTMRENFNLLHEYHSIIINFYERWCTGQVSRITCLQIYTIKHEHITKRVRIIFSFN